MKNTDRLGIVVLALVFFNGMDRQGWNGAIATLVFIVGVTLIMAGMDPAEEGKQP